MIHAWHVSGARFRRFNPRRSAMGGIMWFTEDLGEILAGKLEGTQGQQYVYEVALDVQRPAGWREYEKLMLMQVAAMGFDSVRLENAGLAGATHWIVFDMARVRILKVHKLADLKQRCTCDRRP